MFNIVKWKFGSLHAYKTFGGITEDSTKISRFITFGLINPIFNLLLFMTNFMGPVPSLRIETSNGGFGFFFGMISTLTFSIVNILCFNVNPLFKTVTWICIGLYIFFASIFFMVIEKSQIKTFFWTDNWKTCVQNKIWHHAIHSSHCWNEPSLIGNVDASRAWNVQNFHLVDLGFDNVVDWIKENKNEWNNNPPLWYTDYWIEHLPKRVLKKCYKDIYEKKIQHSWKDSFK